jgi:hypothetical protein
MNGRRLFFAFVFLLTVLLGPGLSALSRDDFNRVVDFTVTIKSLSEVPKEKEAEFLKASKILLLNGTVASLSFLNPEEDRFSVQVELISGEWEGLEAVKSYRCAVIFQGSQYFRTFPARPPRNPDPSVVAPNNRILAVVRPIRIITGEDGRPLWLLEGFFVRRLQ